MTSSSVVVVPASASAAAVDSGFGSGVASGVESEFGFEPGMGAAVKMDRRHSSDKRLALQIPLRKNQP